MRPKIIILVGLIILILTLVLFGTGLKEKALSGIVEDVPQYTCEGDNFCTGCMIDGFSCNCGKQSCDCGNKTVNKSECSLYSL